MIAAAVATMVTIAIWERGRWNVGFFVAPRFALPELLRGLLWGFLLISACAASIVAFTDVRPAAGNGFPWREVFVVFLPAVIHEELMFRGYAFQKLLRRNRHFALAFVALLFAALHAGNPAVTGLGLLNIFLAGLFLGLAYERYARLWFPIGIHTLLVERGSGPDLLTGGGFGVEGSVLMTVVELAAIALLLRRISSARRALETPQVKEWTE
jgi:membrane protease YdiL (CAAX protease family)